MHLCNVIRSHGLGILATKHAFPLQQVVKVLAEARYEDHRWRSINRSPDYSQYTHWWSGNGYLLTLPSNTLDGYEFSLIGQKLNTQKFVPWRWRRNFCASSRRLRYRPGIITVNIGSRQHGPALPSIPVAGYPMIITAKHWQLSRYWGCKIAHPNL